MYSEGGHAAGGRAIGRVEVGREESKAGRQSPGSSNARKAGGGEPSLVAVDDGV